MIRRLHCLWTLWRPWTAFGACGHPFNAASTIGLWHACSTRKNCANLCLFVSGGVHFLWMHASGFKWRAASFGVLVGRGNRGRAAHDVGRLERLCELPERSRRAEGFAEHFNGAFDIRLRGVAAQTDAHAGERLCRVHPQGAKAHYSPSCTRMSRTAPGCATTVNC